MKASSPYGLLLLAALVACDAPQDSQSGKAPTGMIDPGPDAPSRKRAESPPPTTGGGTPGMGGDAGSGGGGVAGGGAPAAGGGGGAAN